MDSGQTPEILNPNVYLNFLTPSAAAQYEITRDVYLVTLGALLWDILSSIPEDWQILRSGRPVACITRLFLSQMHLAGPITTCIAVAFAVTVLWVIASASSSYLFLKRVHAIFPLNKIVRNFFTLLWLAGVGVSFLALPGPFHNYYEISNTKHCTNRRIRDYVFVAFTVPLLFDALVFLAITYKLLSSHRTRKRGHWWTFFCGEALPRFSKAILQGGQQYYLITTGVNVTRSVLVLLPSTSSILQVTPAVPAIALTSAMACRVFRNLKLETLRDTEVGVLTTMRFGDAPAVNVQLPKMWDQPSPEADLERGVMVIDGQA
ncbi:hypothetical protein F5I97DRAFT_1811491 [Phlebopus sp. FC_14]|nr:hypothetical protein F5I97DRAFT_1811491 [Phlebopus sp. FC_14]